MRLQSLEIEHFRAVESAKLRFGPALNVIHGPNDRGKSTIAEAIRAALLITPGSAESRSFVPWDAAGGQFPRVVMTFECQDAMWRVEKVFAQGSRAKAHLWKSTDGGVRFHEHAQGRNVEGKLREFLNWGHAAPGGRGAPRGETYLTTALLGRQGEVGSIFDASLAGDPDEAGRAFVTRALNALGQQPVVTRLIERLKERIGEVYTPSGRHKRTSDSPLVRARDELGRREECLRNLEEAARQGREIEEEVNKKLQECDAALELRDHAHTELEQLRTYSRQAIQRLEAESIVKQRERELSQIGAAFEYLKTAREEYVRTQSALGAETQTYERAISDLGAAEAESRDAGIWLAQTQAAHQSSEQLAASARVAQVSELRAQLERAMARSASAQAAVSARAEVARAESQLATAQDELAGAQQEFSRSTAELTLASALEELQSANALMSAYSSAAEERDRHAVNETSASTALSDAERDLKTSADLLEQAREREKQTQRAAGERAMQVQFADARVLHLEAVARDERDALDRARTTEQRIRRAQAAQSAAGEADAKAVDIDSRLAGNATEIDTSETKLRELEAIGLRRRRQSIASQVEQLSAQEDSARDHRRRAAECRERAGRIESEAKPNSDPGGQKTPGAIPFPVLSLLAALVGGAALGFVVAKFGVSVGTEVAVGVGLIVGILAALAVIANFNGQRKKAVQAWQVDLEKFRAEDTRLRQEASDLDREADALFNSSSSLSFLRRELDNIGGGGDDSSDDGDTQQQNDEALRSNIAREQGRIETLRRERESLQAERLGQLALCAAKRAQAENALAECGSDVTAIAEAEASAAVASAVARLWTAEDQLLTSRQDRERLTDPSSASSHAEEITTAEAQAIFAEAEQLVQQRRRRRQELSDELARADARLEWTRRNAEGINISDIEQRAAEARSAVDANVQIPDSVSARRRSELAKEKMSGAATRAELLAAGIPALRAKCESLQSAFALDAAQALQSSKDEELRLSAALQDAESAPPQPGPSCAQEFRDAELRAQNAEENLVQKRSLAETAATQRDAIRAADEKARFELEAAERQTASMDLELADRDLANSRQILDGIPVPPMITSAQISYQEETLEQRERELKAFEGSLNEVRGKLKLVAGRVGLERIEDEKEAVERAREHAEDQELDYEAVKHLLELVEAVEAQRASHLGRCLATPVTERFLALTGDFYAHVKLDPDLRVEGFVAAGGDHSVQELSVGTQEQLATIVRLAIAAQLKTAVLLDDQLVHSDTERIAWFRDQLRISAQEHKHQIIVITCRLSDYVADQETRGDDNIGDESVDGSSPLVINILDVVRRVNAARA